jgi:hypothetical protein
MAKSVLRTFRMSSIDGHNERVAYQFDQTTEQTPAMWQILMEAVRSRVSEVFIDAHPDPEWPSFAELPERAQVAHKHLAELAL